MNKDILGLSNADEKKFIEYMSKIENIATNYISAVEANCLIIDMMMMFKSVVKYTQEGIDENE